MANEIQRHREGRSTRATRLGKSTLVGVALKCTPLRLGNMNMQACSCYARLASVAETPNRKRVVLMAVALDHARVVGVEALEVGVAAIVLSRRPDVGAVAGIVEIV